MAPALRLPEWTTTFTTVLLILGFPAAVVLAWMFDVVRADKAAPGEAGGIAVLPFANPTGEKEQGHLADGIVGDLLTRLQALIAADDYAAAFELAREIERVTPNDPLLRQLEPSYSAKVRLNSLPAGARVMEIEPT